MPRTRMPGPRFSPRFTRILALAISLAAATWPALLAAEDPIRLHFPEPTPVLDIYRALDAASELDLVLDPDLEDRAITFELPEMPPRAALMVLTRTVGHFSQEVGENTLVIARDTPAQRRHYERLVLRVFVLEHLAVGDAMTVLRSLLDAKRLATVPHHNALVVRETEEKMELVAALLGRLDHPPGELRAADLEPLVLGPADRLGGGDPRDRLAAGE